MDESDYESMGERGANRCRLDFFRRIHSTGEVTITILIDEDLDGGLIINGIHGLLGLVP